MRCASATHLLRKSRFAVRSVSIQCVQDVAVLGCEAAEIAEQRRRGLLAPAGCPATDSRTGAVRLPAPGAWHRIRRRQAATCQSTHHARAKRSFAHAGRWRRLARDNEATNNVTFTLFVQANAMLLASRLARKSPSGFLHYTRQSVFCSMIFLIICESSTLIPKMRN